ncbi:MAG: recombination protein O N-terminal domain-containing protein [Oligoflexia bacterium]|nr:recombination protein O N-terminal domain-containing protein [Oligoflexia bacterium]
MHAKVDGILISKMPYRERDILGKLLLRNGQKITVLFRNARGGKRNKKTLNLELGYFLKTEVNKSNTGGAGAADDSFFAANDWTLIWYHQRIRENLKAFYLMCLFLEMGLKVSLTASVFTLLNEQIISRPNLRAKNRDGEGVFSVLSNALFFLEDSLTKNSFNEERELILFSIKLLYSEGVGMNLSECIRCKMPFGKVYAVGLISKEGGFCCNSCSGSCSGVWEFSEFGEFSYLYGLIKQALITKYRDYHLLRVKNSTIATSATTKIIFNYFCQQFHFSPGEFKSIKSLL